MDTETQLNLLIEKIDKVQEDLEQASQAAHECRDAVVGTIDKAGLAEKIRKLEDTERRRRWTLRAAITAAMASLFNSLF